MSLSKLYKAFYCGKRLGQSHEVIGLEDYVLSNLKQMSQYSQHSVWSGEPYLQSGTGSLLYRALSLGLLMSEKDSKWIRFLYRYVEAFPSFGIVSSTLEEGLRGVIWLQECLFVFVETFI